MSTLAVNDAERDKVEELVLGSVDAGARIRVGGRRPDRVGAFYLPTVLDDVPPDDEILRREIFGPVAPITTFAHDGDAVRLANDSPVGLMAYVMSNDVGRAMRVAEEVYTGMVAVNRGVISDPAAPFGGMKESGIGREGGHEGIEEFLERKYVGVGW